MSLVAIVVVDVLRRYRARDSHPLARGALQALITGAIALPAAAIAYLASWSGWIASPEGCSMKLIGESATNVRSKSSIGFTRIAE